MHLTLFWNASNGQKNYFGFEWKIFRKKYWIMQVHDLKDDSKLILITNLTSCRKQCPILNRPQFQVHSSNTIAIPGIKINTHQKFDFVSRNQNAINYFHSLRILWFNLKFASPWEQNTEIQWNHKEIKNRVCITKTNEMEWIGWFIIKTVSLNKKRRKTWRKNHLVVEWVVSCKSNLSNNFMLIFATQRFVGY